MKTIIAFILSCLSLSAATLYPVMTDNSSRLLPGGQTNFATLNGTNVWSGTNAFAAANFFPVNTIRQRSLFLTNIFVPEIVYATNASSAGFPTNAGELVHCTEVANVTVPPLLTTNSIIAFSIGVGRTNTQTGGTDFLIYNGSSATTNCIYYLANLLGNGTALPAVGTDSGTQRPLLFNSGSFTNQILHPQSAFFQTNCVGEQLFDTATSFNLRFAMASRASGAPNTNMFVWLRVFEIIP